MGYLQGAHSSNPVTGEFSAVAAPAWRIEKGAITTPLKGVMVTGNILDLLRKVSGLSSEVRKLGYLSAPWVRVDDLRAVGR